VLSRAHGPSIPTNQQAIDFKQLQSHHGVKTTLARRNSTLNNIPISLNPFAANAPVFIVAKAIEGIGKSRSGDRT
jgi:hypothetical protein